MNLLPAPYRWLILLALVIAAAGVGWVQGASSESAARDLLDARRIAQEQTSHTRHIQQLRQREHTAAVEINTTTRSTQEKTREDQLDRARLTGALRLGTTRLSVPALCPTPRAGADQTTAAGSGNDAPTRADLPPETAADLVELAGEADDTARALTQCQATVITYLKACSP